MKPCPKNRKLIALLSVSGLEDSSAKALRAHFEECPGCRGYLQEISNVVKNLSAANLEESFTTSPGFHRKVMDSLRNETPASKSLLSWLQWPWRQWGVARPIVAGFVVVLATLIAWQWPAGNPSPVPPISRAPSRPTAYTEPQPTMANYQMVANRSLEELDELLSRQGSRCFPSSPNPTTAGLALLRMTD